MAKIKKQPRPKAQAPKGFPDYFGAEVTQRTEMLSKIAAVYHRYGFDALETSAVETVEALGKFLPDVDRPNEGVFAWEEDNDWLALRYDLTAPLARVAAQYRNDLPFPYRRYAMGPVWRNEKPGPGRFRQFYQCDADTVGSGSVAADAEICAMLSDTLEAVGIERGDYVIRVNNRKVLNGILERLFDEPIFPADEDGEVVRKAMRGNEEAIAAKDERKKDVLRTLHKFDGTGEATNEQRKDDILRTLDKFDKVGEAGIRELLGQGRKDVSGAFIDGLKFDDPFIDVCVAFLKARGASNTETIKNLRAVVAGSSEGAAGVDELQSIASLLEAQGYGPDRIIIDPSVVRGLGYYTGPVYEAELIFEIKDEKGRPRNFGSVAGGGRYDDLVKRFTGQEVPATGVSIGVDRLLAALRAKGQVESRVQGPVVVTVMDRDRMADYQTMVADLRNAGIRAEVYLGNPKNFGNQLKYADKRASPIAVIAGSDEFDKGIVQIKDLILGAEIAKNATLEEWKDRPSQYEVPREQMIAKVREILDTHS